MDLLLVWKWVLLLMAALHIIWSFWAEGEKKTHALLMAALFLLFLIATRQ